MSTPPLSLAGNRSCFVDIVAVATVATVYYIPPPLVPPLICIVRLALVGNDALKHANHCVS